MHVRCTVGAVETGRSFYSLQVRSDNFDQVGGPLGFRGVLLMRGIDNVMPDVILEKLRGQSVHGAPHRSDQHQHVGAAEFGFQRALDRVKLSLDASNPADEL